MEGKEKGGSMRSAKLCKREASITDMGDSCIAFAALCETTDTVVLKLKPSFTLLLFDGHPEEELLEASEIVAFLGQFESFVEK